MEVSIFYWHLPADDISKLFKLIQSTINIIDIINSSNHGIDLCYLSPSGTEPGHVTITYGPQKTLHQPVTSKG
ncbi:hypothetical protein HanPSC8_Chr13g0562421 [Helianthus annuus]|nr:hypothetical protein HanPSC8_Chr13g0562421 [Helianthus annuus]